MKPKWSFLVLVFCIAGYALIFPFFEKHRYPERQVQARELILPPHVMKLLALEFRTVTADFLFARASQYYGGRSYRPWAWTKNDYAWLYNNLRVTTELDPYFEDPYYFGNAIFTWDVGAVNEANSLLEKGVRARTWDWQLPFYLGFNKFYFLHKNKEAADDLLLASKRQGAYDFLPTLAARLYNSEGRTEAAIVFLTAFLKNERDAKIRGKYAIRLEALKRMLFIERAVARYKNKTKKPPRNLQALVQSGIISEIPEDPYGGKFYLNRDGSIKTTSKLALPANPEKK